MVPLGAFLQTTIFYEAITHIHARSFNIDVVDLSDSRNVKIADLNSKPNENNTSMPRSVRHGLYLPFLCQ